MEQILINDTLRIEYPDSFHEMSEEEKAGLNAKSCGKSVSLISPELHIIVSVGWTRVDGIRGVVSRLTRGNDLVKNAENFYQKRMKSMGYRTEEYLNGQIGGVDAQGLRYSYTVQGIGMMAETYSLTKNEVLYYFHSYYRAQLMEESRAIWKTMLDSVRWE